MRDQTTKTKLNQQEQLLNNKQKLHHFSLYRKQTDKKHFNEQIILHINVAEKTHIGKINL